jgi:hypothetical protein
MHQIIVWRIPESNAQLLTDHLHALIFEQNVTCKALEVFITSELDQPTQQFGPHPLTLKLISGQKSKLSLIGPRGFDQTTNANDLMTPTLRIVILGNQRHLAVVVNETSADQPLMGDTLAKL